MVPGAWSGRLVTSSRVQRCTWGSTGHAAECRAIRGALGWVLSPSGGQLWCCSYNGGTADGAGVCARGHWAVLGILGESCQGLGTLGGYWSVPGDTESYRGAHSGNGGRWGHGREELVS